MLRQLASLAAPPLCGVCAAPCVPAATLCPRCDRALVRVEPRRSALTGGLKVVSAAPYEGVAQELVRRLKFSSRLALAEFAAERMARAWGTAREGWLVPVPPAPARARARGFDDASILARLIARGCPYARVAECLVRDDGPRQVRRTRKERTADPPRIRLTGAAIALPPGEFWIVDDVVTTGATLQSCAQALSTAGAEDVFGLTFARADN